MESPKGKIILTKIPNEVHSDEGRFVKEKFLENKVSTNGICLGCHIQNVDATLGLLLVEFRRKCGAGSESPVSIGKAYILAWRAISQSPPMI